MQDLSENFLYEFTKELILNSAPAYLRDKELDMQGTEYEWELKVKTQFGAAIERKTDTFSVEKK